MNKLHWSIHKHIHCIGEGLRYLIGSKERIDFEAANKLVLVEARHPDTGGRDRDHPDASCSCQISIFTQSSLTFCKEFVKFPRLLCHGRGVMCLTDAPDCSLSLSADHSAVSVPRFSASYSRYWWSLVSPMLSLISPHSVKSIPSSLQSPTRRSQEEWRSHIFLASPFHCIQFTLSKGHWLNTQTPPSVSLT